MTQTGDALSNLAYALAMQYGGRSEDYEKFPILEAEWEFISAALPHLMTGDNDRLQTVCVPLFQFLDFTGRWDEMLWLYQQAEEHAIATDDKENGGWMALWAGWTYQLRKQPAEVLRCADRAAEHWQDSTMRDKAAAIRLRGFGHILNKDYSAAIAAFREVLEILRSDSPESKDFAILLSDLAGAEHLNKHYSAAERDYREALHIAKKNNDQEMIAGILGNLAELALDREQWTEAEALAREALELSEKVGQNQLIASDSRLLAKALLKQSSKSDWQHLHLRAVQVSDLQEALSLSRRAVEIFMHLRVPDDLQSAQEMLAEIEQAMQDNK